MAHHDDELGRRELRLGAGASEGILELALRSNTEGVFLKLSTRAGGGHGGVSKVFVAAPYLSAFVAALRRAAASCPGLPVAPRVRADDTAAGTSLFEARVVMGRSRTLFVDVRTGSLGQYARLSLVQPGGRSSVTVSTSVASDGAQPQLAPGSALAAIADATADLVAAAQAAAPELVLVLSAAASPAAARRSSVAAAAAEEGAPPPADMPGAASLAEGAAAFAAVAPLARHLRVGDRKYYVDADHHQHSLRITEVAPGGRRATVALPLAGLPALHAVLSEYLHALMGALPGHVAAAAQSATLSALSGGSGHLGHGLFGTLVSVAAPNVGAAAGGASGEDGGAATASTAAAAATAGRPRGGGGGKRGTPTR